MVGHQALFFSFCFCFLLLVGGWWSCCALVARHIPFVVLNARRAPLGAVAPPPPRRLSSSSSSGVAAGWWERRGGWVLLRKWSRKAGVFSNFFWERDWSRVCKSELSMKVFNENDFTEIRELGRGAFGRVYLSRLRNGTKVSKFVNGLMKF